MNETLVLAGSGVAGLIGGASYGFFFAAHSAASSGYTAAPQRRILRLLTAVHARLSFGEAIALLVLLALSLALFFACIAVPAILSSRIAPGWESLPFVGYAVLLSASSLGWRFGKHVWRTVS